MGKSIKQTVHSLQQNMANSPPSQRQNMANMLSKAEAVMAAMQHCMEDNRAWRQHDPCREDGSSQRLHHLQGRLWRTRIRDDQHIDVLQRTQSKLIRTLQQEKDHYRNAHVEQRAVKRMANALKHMAMAVKDKRQKEQDQRTVGKLAGALNHMTYHYVRARKHEARVVEALRGEVRKEKKLGKMMDELADDRMRIKKQLEIDQYKKVQMMNAMGAQAAKAMRAEADKSERQRKYDEENIRREARRNSQTQQ